MCIASWLQPLLHKSTVITSLYFRMLAVHEHNLPEIIALPSVGLSVSKLQLLSVHLVILTIFPTSSAHAGSMRLRSSRRSTSNAGVLVAVIH